MPRQPRAGIVLLSMFAQSITGNREVLQDGRSQCLQRWSIVSSWSFIRRHASRALRERSKHLFSPSLSPLIAVTDTWIEGAAELEIWMLSTRRRLCSSHRSASSHCNSAAWIFSSMNVPGWARRRSTLVSVGEARSQYSRRSEDNVRQWLISIKPVTICEGVLLF